MKPIWRGIDTDGNNVNTPADDCSNCGNFTTQPILWPGGICTLHNVKCGHGFTCVDFTARKEVYAKRKRDNLEIVRKLGKEIRKRMGERQ